MLSAQLVAEEPSPRAVFVGGVHWGCRTVYWPLVELRVYGDGLEIRPHRMWVQLLALPGRLFGTRIPTARFSWSQLERVEEQVTGGDCSHFARGRSAGDADHEVESDHLRLDWKAAYAGVDHRPSSCAAGVSLGTASDVGGELRFARLRQ